MADLTKPEVKFAKSGSIHIAYTVSGNGPVNVVLAPGVVSHQDFMWEYPGFARFFEGMTRFARVAHFDKRGTGLSDRDVGIPTFEERMDDIRAVMDAVRFERAILIGFSEGVPMTILFAASYPSRTMGLVLCGGEARGLWAPDYPWASTAEEWEASFQRTEAQWGSRESDERKVTFLAPSRLGDEQFTSWLSRLFRMGSSPGALLALSKSEMMMDVRNILPTIHVPTLVIHLTDDRACKVEEGRYIAHHIPGARLVELPGIDHLFYVDDGLTTRVLEELKNFISEVGQTPETTRVLTTVLFTDIVDSTKKATELGDQRWQKVLEEHNSMVEEEVRRFQGSKVKNTGDGFLAIFDGPTRAIRCACAVRDGAERLGLKVRAGLHTGECTVGRDDVSGIAVHLAARVLSTARPSEVVVSSTVKDLVTGSKIEFSDLGLHQFKGVDEEWRLFSVRNVKVN